MSKPTAFDDVFVRLSDFEEMTRLDREWEQDNIRRHAADCFGEYGKCLSCGCDRQNKLYARGSRPCISHRGSPAHLADAIERLITALEKATP